MRRRSEAGIGSTGGISPDADPRQQEIPGSRVATTFATKCAVCKLPQELEAGTTNITCPKGHRGAFGLTDEGNKVEWKNGAFAAVTSFKPSSSDPKPSLKKQIEDLQKVTGDIEQELDRREAFAEPPAKKKSEKEGPAIESEYVRGVTEGFESTQLDDVVSVTYGTQKISPIQYNVLEIGPFTGTTHVRAGETRADAMHRLYEELAVIADEVYRKESPKFLARVREAAKAARTKD